MSNKQNKKSRRKRIRSWIKYKVGLLHQI